MLLLEEFLLDTPWVKRLKAGHRARLLAETRERTVQRGVVFCQTGQRVEYWKGVIEGLVKVSVVSAEGRTSTLTGLANGAWFGEGPVLRAKTWDFDGVAMRETRIALVPRATFEWLMDVSPEFNRWLNTSLSLKQSVWSWLKHGWHGAWHGCSTLFCTRTLARGSNFPSRRLVIWQVFPGSG